MIGSEASHSTSMFDLSQSQSLIWTGQQLNPDSPMYNMAFAFEISGKLDVTLFKTAFTILIDKSDVMRSIIKTENQQPKLYIHSSLDFTLELIDFSNKSEDDIKTWIDHRCKKIFDLSACLFDSILIKKTDEKYIWVLNQHHLITDGWSKTVQFKTLSEIYKKLMLNESLDTLKRPSYVSYLHYEQKAENQNEPTKTYWKNTTDLIKHEVSSQVLQSKTSTASVRKSCDLTQDMITALKHLVTAADLRSWTTDISLFTVFASALSILLSRRTNSNKLVLGVPFLNRQTSDHKNTIGLFMELFPMPIEVKTDDTFLSLYIRTRTSYFECLKNAGSGRSNVDMASTIPVIVNYMNGRFGDFAGMATKTEWVFVDHVDPGHAIRLQVFDFDESGTFNVSLDMNTAVFNENQQEEFIREFNKLLTSFISDKNKRINEISDSEREILNRVNKVDVGYPKDKTLVDLFEDQVQIHPNKIAVKDGSKSLSYSQLNKKANQLAHHLKSLGIEEGEMVAISLDRSMEIIVAIMATIKLGCIYVPIDPIYPTERVHYMLKDSGARWAITQANLKSIFSGVDITLIDISNEVVDTYEVDAPTRSFTSEQSLYVIYTSGSTGRPKGVVIDHKNVIRLFFNDAPLYDFNHTDVWTLFHSICFDWSVWEMYGPLLTGGTLVIVTKEVSINPEAYTDLLLDNNVTVLNQTPRAFYNLQSIYLPRQESTSIRYVIFGGEALSPIRLKEWKSKYPECKLINMYGITETTVHVTYKELQMADIESGESNIGTAIPTLECLIVDESMNELPFGMAGELYVGGAGLANRYLNREDLTQERFIPHPFRNNERVYRTGDIALRLANGDIKYLGRADSQVKIRGHRIELGEIEAAINKHTSIQQSAVIAHTDEKENVRLIAYIVTKEEVVGKSIEQHLAQILPTFMMPQAIINLPSMRLTNNGKIDKSKLPIFDPNSLSTIDDFVSPETEIQEFVAEIWTRVLGVEKISINQDFFRIGGDSLSGIRVLTSINNELELNLPVNLIFEMTTIAAMAKHIEETIKKLMLEMEND